MTKVFMSIGAGPGIGLATARRFADAGYRILLASRSQASLETQAAALAAVGASVSTMQLDAADSAAVADAVRSAGPDLEVLHYNAGVLHYDTAGQLQPRPIGAETVASLALDTQINITSAMTAIHSALPAMQARGTGTLLLTGGGLGVQPSGDFLTLSVGKAAIRAMATALFEPLSARGIHVATVTVSRLVSPKSPEAAAIGQAFWELHAQPAGQWTVETTYR